MTALRERLASIPARRPSRRTVATIALAALALAAGAALLRVITGVGFANYDTLYALAWGGQLSRGALPAYEVPIAPTPHPLVELLGVVLSPLSARAPSRTSPWRSASSRSSAARGSSTASAHTGSDAPPARSRRCC